MPAISTPTHSNLGIRGAADAFVLFEAVRTGIFPLRRHRLSQHERENLAPGQVFVWTESNEADGLERWTDGRRWSASRTRDVFLIYEEREELSVDESVERAAQRINTYFSGSQAASGDLFGIFAFPRDRPPKLDGLMKQTFSAWVTDPTSGSRCKWHLSAYLSRQSPTDLPFIIDDAILSRVSVPAGIYESCTGPRKHRKGSGARPAAVEQPPRSSPSAEKLGVGPQARNNRVRGLSMNSGSSSSTLSPYEPDYIKPQSQERWEHASYFPTGNPTPPRTISSSSIASTDSNKMGRRTSAARTPHGLPPLYLTNSYSTNEMPPSPTDSVSSLRSSPTVSISYGHSPQLTQGVPMEGYRAHGSRGQSPYLSPVEHKPYMPVSAGAVNSYPQPLTVPDRLRQSSPTSPYPNQYKNRSEVDSKTLAAFRPF